MHLAKPCINVHGVTQPKSHLLPRHNSVLSSMSSITHSNSTLMSSASPPEYKTKDHGVVDMVLRVILFATAMVSIVFMVTSKQTKIIWPVGMYKQESITVNFSYTPAFIYYVAAASVVCLYSIMTGVLSFIALMKPNGRSTEMLLLFVVLDALLLGIMASATGTAGGIAYRILIGDTHRRRNNLCDSYSSFCHHIAGSVLLSLLPCVTLLLLVFLSGLVLSKKMRRL